MSTMGIIQGATGSAIMYFADRDPNSINPCVKIWATTYRDLVWAGRENYQRHENKNRRAKYEGKKAALRLLQS